ncbi:hypothetical protein VNI00_012110 [Paramarasmius palmivorus]|uniref:F-box domain-containing protein n=1 Tax=Paramarasmius palmivorus TaxID=297713 RepID=A0AAW0C6Y8_9AGAR
MNLDEGYTDDLELENALPLHGLSQNLSAASSMNTGNLGILAGISSPQDCEELAYRLLASLPRSRLATIQRRIAPLLQFDVVGSLPAEVSLQIFSHLPFPSLLACNLVSRRWNSLANDQTLWKTLCRARGWVWRQPARIPPLDQTTQHRVNEVFEDSDDEGMGDSDEEAEVEEVADSLILTGLEAAKAELTLMHAELDSGFASMSFERAPLFNAFLRSKSTGTTSLSSISSTTQSTGTIASSSSLQQSNPLNNSVDRQRMDTSSQAYPFSFGSDAKGKGPMTAKDVKDVSLHRHSAPVGFSPSNTPTHLKPNYKLLYLTHVKLQHRILTSSYRLSTLQSRNGATQPGTSTQNTPNPHTNTIYCLQLYTYASSGKQVLFTGSRDKTIREWNLSTGVVERVIGGVHTSSVLSICVANGLLASAGSDRRVVVWDLGELDSGADRLGDVNNRSTVVGPGGLRVLKVIEDHEDSVLCVRFDKERLVSCSKDRTVRTYPFPELEPQYVLSAHRAAVNAISISPTLIVSGSGDRSIRLWDATTGALLRTFENHHSRGIASIDFRPPYVLSGSSDKHLRIFDITTLQGWSTSPDAHQHSHSPATGASTGSSTNASNILPLPLSLLGPTPLTPQTGTSGFFPLALPFSSVDDEDDLLAFTYPYSSSHGRSSVACQVCGSTSTVPVYGGSSSAENACHNVYNDFGGFDSHGFGNSSGSAGSSSGSTSGAAVNFAGTGLMMIGPGGKRFVPGVGRAGFVGGFGGAGRSAIHMDLVRSVAFGEDFVLSGSYDLSIKVWDRKTGALIADLTGGHTGRIFCIGFDCTKIVSCGEDQRICIWDFSHGIDTSFIQL